MYKDPGSGALVFKRSPEQKAIKELKEENKKLKQLLALLIQVQDNSIKDQIPQELLTVLDQ